MQLIDYAELVGHGLLALGGGITYAIKQGKGSWITFLSNIFMASFSGGVVGLIAFQVIGQDFPYIAYAITGVSGHVGPPMLVSIGKAINNLIVDKLNSLGRKK